MRHDLPEIRVVAVCVLQILELRYTKIRAIEFLPKVGYDGLLVHTSQAAIKHIVDLSLGIFPTARHCGYVCTRASL